MKQKTYSAIILIFIALFALLIVFNQWQITKLSKDFVVEPDTYTPDIVDVNINTENSLKSEVRSTNG
ncbi:hypothetical protein ACFLZN_01270 [Nanoarchaeota archaeon]